MADDDFYVDDESPDEVRAAWRRGEKGVTTGSRDLNVRARSIVDRAVASLDADDPTTEEVVVVASGGTAMTTIVDGRVQSGKWSSPVKNSEYLVGSSRT